MKKLFLEAIFLVLLIYSCFFTGRTNIQMFETGMSRGGLRDPVSGRPADQMMGHSRDFRGTSVKYVLNSIVDKKII